MTYANQAIMHDIEFVEIIIIIFQPWTDSFYSYIKGSPQWAVVLLGYLTFSKQQLFAPVQLSYVSKAIMHDIGFAETIIMVFRPWTVSSYYYIERQPPMSSCVPDAHNILKVAKFCTSSIGLRQQSHHARYRVCRDYFFFRLWTVSSYCYIKRLPPVSSYSPDALNVFKMAKFGSS